MAVRRNYRINLRNYGNPPAIMVSQYDENYDLVFEVYDGVVPATGLNVYTVKLVGRQPGDDPALKYEFTGTVSGIANNILSFTIDTTMTGRAGKGTAEIVILDTTNDVKFASFNLPVYVEKAAVPDDAIDADVERAQEIAEQVEELIDGATEGAEAWAVGQRGGVDVESTDPTYHNNAKYYSEVAQDIADSIGIDATLSISGKAADAKKTGDEIGALKEDLSTIENQMKELETALENVSIDPDDLGLEQDADTFYVYPTYKGVRSENGIPLASSGGGGGGGGEVVSAVLTVTNTTGWLSKTISQDGDCVITMSWSSIEDEMPTGDGNIRISVNDVVKTTYQIKQGNISVDLAPYLNVGTNKVKVRISDTYDQGKTTTFTITVVALSITSSFDASVVYSNAISFPYTPVGAVEKTVYFVVDGTTIGTQVTPVSNRQMTYMIPAQPHGAHSLRVYFEAVINNETVRSNELYYEFLFVDITSKTPIIASSFNKTSVPQYSTVAIPFSVYTPDSLTSDITISANGTVISSQTVDRTEQSYSYKANNAGSLTLTITTGKVSKEIRFTVAESEIDVEAETENLALYLSAQGRSNQEVNPAIWTYGEGVSQIACIFDHFNFVSDGWQKDADNNVVLRVAGDARLTIPYKPFEHDFRTTGKTIEIEFETRNVLNYDSIILSCMSGNRGITLTAQKATLKSEQTEISTQYKEEDHIRVSFVVEKRSENRLVFVFINSIPSGVVIYPNDDDFSQTSPVNITVGSNDCSIDIYNIRVYDNDLTRYQILNNWIADTADGSLMLDRYLRNNVYDAYGNITIANLPSDLPYYILNAEELPQYKGDKKTISGSYVDPLYPSRSFTFTGCQINVQGTSSAPYARKNYDMQFKNGFELNSGHADKYALTLGAIPFNRFVLKADVASSEGANNVELVRLYNDACLYKTPEMEENSKVRWGIDGFPIVVFWNDTTTGNVSFLGKYNFNLPKRAPAPYGYDKDDTLESWEFENNTSDLMIFKTDYFDPTTYIDDEGNVLPNWRKDFEARFPSDEWLNIDILQEFVSFVVSTDRDKATGNTLSSPVTYEDVTYTTDSADYRLAKFRAEFPTYAVLDSFLFYYIFTELFLMVDSRAKNLFIGFNGENVTASGRKAKRKATAQPYDMDTAAGTNNEGSLVFSYNLEDTDTLAGGANIFNGQYSTLWCNIRDAYSAEIIQMYQRLRSAGTLSYSTVEQRYEDHQSKWCEAIWMEDAWFKYIDPLISPDAGKEPTAVYLPMMQGSKEEQRKWWLINRFKYMDSKWNAGDALSQVIQLRGYAKANITVTPYFDIYPTARYGGYLVKERGEHNKPSELVCPIDTLNDTEIYIYSAPQLKSVGDLAPLKVGFADFSMATRLQNIKIGDSSTSYENTNLYSLSLGSNKLLKMLDVRNCSGLGDTSLEGHTQTTVDLSGCEIIEEVYFGGTKIQGVTLPNGGVLRTLSLPSTITNLVVRNQNKIQTFAVENNDYSNITTLRIENCSSAIPVLDILSEIPTNSRVRLIGFTTSVNSTTEVEDFYDYLDTMRGLDESGGNVDTAQVSGTITGLQNITGAWLAEMNARYPFITIEYEHITSNLYYYNYDGTTLLNTEAIVDGGNGTYSGTPSRTATAQYTYSFIGWSLEQDAQTADSNATKNVSADRNIYAAYSRTLRSYTVYWRNVDNTLLETDTNVNYGSMPQYNGAPPTYEGRTAIGWSPSVSSVVGDVTYTATYVPTYQVNFYNDNGTTLLQTVTVEEGSTAVYTGTTPTNSEDASLEWLGWATSKNAHEADAVLTNIQSNMVVYAAFESVVEVAEITDDWDTIIANIDNGTYSTVYKVGNYKPLDAGDWNGDATTLNMQIVAFDQDIDANGNTVPITFISKELIPNSLATVNYTIFPIRLENILSKMPQTVLSRVNSVIKDRASSSGLVSETVKFWVPSATEVGVGIGAVKYEETNTHNYAMFKNAESRIKTHNSSNEEWQLRSVDLSGNLISINAKGDRLASSQNYYVLGFCLGLEPETITDSWSTILANESPSTSYSIGDTKMLDLGTEGKHLMEIVAFDEDDKADGTGKAKITWISKDLLATAHRMNPANSSGAIGTGGNGGWEHCEMRTYLTSTIKPLIPAEVRNGIVEVIKIQSTVTDGTQVIDGQTTVDDVWIPSNHEVGLGTSYETTGAVYSSKFTNAQSRIKKRNSSAYYWWLRSAFSASYFRYVGSNGRDGNYYASNAYGVALGFCTN